MSEKQIIKCFQKVDEKFLKELGTAERGEAVDEFRHLW